jgi:DNA-binding transcriptional LysR family regulator
MDIRQLQYLASLARERHFTRAASACNVTQSTLSGRIRQLEQELGVPIVERGQRFRGLTPEGERVLAWAQQILGNCEAMTQELAAMKGDLTGQLVLGVIPSALPTTPPLTEAVRRRFPGLSFGIHSATSNAIHRHLEDFSINAGITYLDNEPLGRVLSQPLYAERYRLFLRGDHRLAGADGVTWAQAAREPLCLLTPDMQNRRIIDAALQRIGQPPEPVIETNSVISLFANVQVSGFGTILPEYFADVAGHAAEIVGIPLMDPEVEHTVGLVALDHDPVPTVVTALFAAGRDFRMPACLTRRLGT